MHQKKQKWEYPSNILFLSDYMEYFLSSDKYLLRAAIFLAIGLALFFLMSVPAQAATYYWAGAATELGRWESATNWASIPKGPAGAGIPGASDTVVLFSSGAQVRIRSAVSIAGLVINNVWTGSLLQGTGTLSIGVGGVKMGSGKLIGGNAAVTILGNFTQTGGYVTGLQNTTTLSGSLSVTKGGTVVPQFSSTGTLTLNGNIDQNFTIGANVTKVFQNLTLNNAGGTTNDDVHVNVNGGLALSGSLTITLGNLDLDTNNNRLNVEGNVTIANAAQATMVTESNWAVAGNISVGDAATLTVSGGTLTLNGSADQALDIDGQSLYNLTINNSGGGTSDDITVAGGILRCSGALVITLGNLDTASNSLDMNIDGNVTLADAAQASMAIGNAFLAGNVTVNRLATFSQSAGTMTLDGTNQTMSGSFLVNKLTKSVTSAYTLTIYPTEGIFIAADLILKGTDGNLLSLRSGVSGTAFKILASNGPRSTSYLDVKDSNNAHVTPLACTTGCTDSGNNTNWTFTVATTAATAATSGTSSGGGGGRRSASTASKLASTPTAPKNSTPVISTPVGGPSGLQSRVAARKAARQAALDRASARRAARMVKRGLK